MGSWIRELCKDMLYVAPACAVVGHDWRYNAAPEIYALEQKRFCPRCHRCEVKPADEWFVPPFFAGKWSDVTLTLEEREAALANCASEKRRHPVEKVAEIEWKHLAR